jgi:hypothetical protein
MAIIKIPTIKEVEVILLIVKAKPRYWEDSKINGVEDTEFGDNIPCKEGDNWSPIIVIDTGKIVNWKQGVKAEIHYKVCDEFGYEILGSAGQVLFSKEYGYVPNTMCPKERGFCDYIIMDIDESGQIINWKFNADDFNLQL